MLSLQFGASSLCVSKASHQQDDAGAKLDVLSTLFLGNSQSWDESCLQLAKL